MTAGELVPFVREGLGNSSYLLGVGGGKALLVDPDRTADRYLEAAAVRGWDVVAVLETHLHADFVTGSLEVRAATGATLYVPAGGGVAFPHRDLAAGDRLEVGEVEVRALASPGHTPEHLSYVVRRAGAPVPLLFSGGALIAGGAARTDLVSPDLTESLTRAQFRTLREAFAELPDETLVLPTHGGGSFCSVGAARRRTSTLGEERRSNPVLAYPDEEAFVREWPRSFPGAPAYFSRMREVNRAGPRLRAEVAPPPALPPEAFDRARSRGALVVDARPAEAYLGSHVPGALAIPLRDSFATWLGWLVEPGVPLLLVADGVSLGELVEEALLVGYERFAGFLAGGMAAWEGAGLPVARTEALDPASVARALAGGAVALDVREPDEVARGRVEGAIHIPLGQLAARLAEVPAGRPVITYCRLGDRSATAASVLERAGVPAATLAGGYVRWREVMAARP